MLKKEKKEDPKGKGESSQESGGEKFFSEFSRSDFIKDSEVAEVEIVDAFDPAEEIGIDEDSYDDESY